ncbi:MAG: STAS domain-containing protein [Wenzhouxiangella sp.]|jgi:anti-anti-sigma factor|nr:STAS domain-containing protein [Wenzhouxiangella sp.]
MEFEIIEQTDELTHVALRGRLDTLGTDQVELKFTATVAPAGNNTIVDISELTFLASMGIRMLLSVAKTLAGKQARMVLLAPQALVRESIDHAALDAVIPVARDMDEARAALA